RIERVAHRASHRRYARGAVLLGALAADGPHPGLSAFPVAERGPPGRRSQPDDLHHRRTSVLARVQAVHQPVATGDVGGPAALATRSLRPPGPHRPARALWLQPLDPLRSERLEGAFARDGLLVPRAHASLAAARRPRAISQLRSSPDLCWPGTSLGELHETAARLESPGLGSDRAPCTPDALWK